MNKPQVRIQTERKPGSIVTESLSNLSLDASGSSTADRREGSPALSSVAFLRYSMLDKSGLELQLKIT